MTRLVLLVGLITIVTCTYSKRTLDKIKDNKHCEECDQYIYQVLIPQLESCTYNMDAWEDCKFDRDEFEKYGSCFVGMKRERLEDLLGKEGSFGYSVKDRAQDSYLFWFDYYYQNNRLIEIVNVNDVNVRNSNIACLGCDQMYEKIRSKKRLKNKNTGRTKIFFIRSKYC